MGGVTHWLVQFPGFYDSSWPLVDALIFTLVFVGLSRAVLERRFSGQGGKALILGMGLALTVGMVWAEITYGFSLRSFGPLAMTLVGIILVMMIYQTGQAFGLSKVASASLVLFAGLPLVAQILPGIAELISGVLPLVILFWLASGVLTGTNGWHSRGFGRWKQDLKDESSELLGPGEERESKSLDRREKKDARRAYRHSKHIIRILRRIRSDLKTLGSTEEGRKKLHHELEKLAREEHELVRELADLHETVHRVWGEGEHIYRRVRVTLKRSTGRPRRKAKDAEKDLRKEFTLQQALETLGARFRQFDGAFRQAISQAVGAIQRNRLDDAKRWVDHALHWELRAQGILGEVRLVQKEAHSVLRREIKDLEEAA